MSEKGFTVRKAKLKGGGFQSDFESLQNVYWEWLKQARDECLIVRLAKYAV